MHIYCTHGGTSERQLLYLYSEELFYLVNCPYFLVMDDNILFVCHTYYKMVGHTLTKQTKRESSPRLSL